MTVFHVGARVRLLIRTEEYADTGALVARLPAQTPSQAAPYGAPADAPPPESARPASSQDVAAALARNEAQIRALYQLRDSLPEDEFVSQRSILLGERDAIRTGAIVTVQLEAGGVRPDALAGATDDLTVIGSILPISVSLQRAGLTTPDTCSVTLNYADAPFDPRSIRSCGIEVLIGVIPPDDYTDGVELGMTRADGSLVSMIGEGSDGWIRGATRFVGFVNEWSVKYSSDQGDSVTLSCRDMSALLRDTKINPGESIDLSLPIDQGVAAFISAVSPATAGVVVKYRGEGDPPVPASGAPKKRLPRRGKVARRARRGGPEMTMWDHIVDVCASIGMIPQVRDFDIVIAEARTLYGTADALRMVYGKNIDELSFTRKLQGVKVPTIEVRAYDSAIGRTRWARWPVRAGERRSGVFGIDNPPPPLRANEVTPSGAHPTESIRTIFVSGVQDPIVLERVARNAFQQIGRQEIEGELSTFDVSSYDHDPLEVDLLDARPADPIEVLIVAASSGAEDAVSTLAQLQQFTRARRQAYLESLGWDSKVAARFAQLQDANGFQTVFRIQELRVEYDVDEGVKINVGFINYITVREDA